MLDAATLTKLRGLALRAERVGARGWLGAPFGGREMGTTVVGLRDYTPGDDPHTIDWLWCARRDELLTKVFGFELAEPAWVLLDGSRSMAGEKFSAARRLAEAVAYAAAAAGQSVRFVYIAAGGPVELLRLSDLRRFPAWRRNLESLTADGAELDWSRAAAGVLRRGERAGPVVLIGDFFGGRDLDGPLNRLLTQGYRPHVVQVYATAEAECRVLGDVELVDVEHGAARQAVITERMAAAYRQAFASFLHSIAATCRKRRVPCWQVRTDTPLDDLLPELFGLTTP